MRHLILALLFAGTPGSLHAQEVPLTNDSFQGWKAGRPVGWDVFVGARRGRGNESLVRAGPEGGLALEGNAETKIWHCVAQSFVASERACYRLAFEARARRLRKERGQFSSCYVGLAFVNKNGRTIRAETEDVTRPTWATERLFARAPNGTVTGEIRIFLSMTGLLEVRKVGLRRLRPEESFRVLAEDMGRRYSYFDHKGIDWASLTGRYRDRAERARDEADFILVTKEMLSGLEDMHVWIADSRGRLIPTHSKKVARNYDYAVVAGRLKEARRIGRVALVGKTKEGYGYVAVWSLEGDDATWAALEKAIEGVLDAPGLLVDIRACTGGAEIRAQRIAAMFTDRPVVYARQRYRAGPRPTDFTRSFRRVLEPGKGKSFTRPIVCLVGPVCVSSGEGFAMMMKALPHATLVGLATRGASGNPAPLALPNGITVCYSRWVSMLPDGTVTEGKGIPPDVVVPHRGEGDPTFDAALRELQRRIEHR